MTDLRSEAVNDIEIKPIMTDEELARWQALPPHVQLERMRQAIERGFTSGLSTRSMDDIWQNVLAEFSDAKL